MVTTDAEFVSKYNKHRSKRLMIGVVCLALCVLFVILNVSVGLYNISFTESFQVLIDHLSGIVPETPKEMRDDFIVWEQRLPRAIAACFVGATLATCGAAMQSVLKNPLADPYTTGISSGASLGVTIAVVLGFSIIPVASVDMSLLINAFIFALLPAAAIIIASEVCKSSPTSVILVGIAVMYVFSAFSSLLMLISDPDDLTYVSRWTMGNLGQANWDNLPFLIISTVLAFSVLSMCSRRMNILAMNDENVTSLGLNPKTERGILLIVVSICTSMVVCFTGTIGFVGLIVPHIIRIFLGADNTYLIFCSGMAGALFLLLADTVAKVAGTTDMPVGVITSLIGGPLFLYILMKQRKAVWS